MNIDWLKIHKVIVENISMFLWGCFLYSTLVGRVDLAVLFVLLLLYWRIDRMEIQININNQTFNVKAKEEK